MRISIGSEQLTALPKAIQRRNDRAWYHNFQYLLHKVLVKARTRWQLTKILQRPRHLAYKNLHRQCLLHHLQVRQQRLVVENRRVLILQRLYEQLIVRRRVHVAEVLLGVGEFLLQTAANLQPQLINVRVNDDGLETDTEGAEN